MFSTIPLGRANNQSYFTFNSLNAYILKGEGAQGMDLTFATLMARAGDEPDAVYGLAAKSVQISPDKLVYRFTLRPEARFHDGTRLTAHDAAFSLTTLKTKGHPLDPAADARHGEGRGTTTRRWSSPSPKSARATCRSMSPACRFSRRPITRRGRSTNPRSNPARLRALQGREIRARPLHRIRARQGLVGRRSSGLRAASIISTRCVTSSIATARSAFEGFTGEKLPVPRRIHLAGLGDALRFPGDQGRPGQARDPARRNAVRRAGLVHQHPPRKIQGSARARGADPGVRFRMDQQDHHVRRLRAHPFAVSEFRFDGERAAVAGRTRAAGAVPRPGA